MVVGDFNHPVLKWADEISPKDGDHPSSKFMEAIRDSFLVQHVKKPTYFPNEQTPNVLDLVFTSKTRSTTRQKPSSVFTVWLKLYREEDAAWELLQLCKG